MSARDDAGFGYRIRPAGSGWSWTTFDREGRIAAQGAAPDKALAAAFVIRAISRATLAEQQAQAA